MPKHIVFHLSLIATLSSAKTPPFVRDTAIIPNLSSAKTPPFVRDSNNSKPLKCKKPPFVRDSKQRQKERKSCKWQGKIYLWERKQSGIFALSLLTGFSRNETIKFLHICHTAYLISVL